ncbi:unnamed protein product [Ixodes persulcatus]
MYTTGIGNARAWRGHARCRSENEPACAFIKKKKGNDVLLRLRMPKKVSLLTPDPHVDRLFAPLFPLIVTKRRSTNSFLRECVRSRAGRLFLTKKHRDNGRLQSSVIVLRK